LRLTNLISVIKRCDLFVGNSTGPTHIAAALGRPVVAIFGSRHPLDCPATWAPRTSNAITVKKETACEICHPTDCESFECMNAVTVEDVFNACGRLLD
jgi:ADP-heptose:LPS heptosyltransferase